MGDYDSLKDLLQKNSAPTPPAPEWGSTQAWNKIQEQRYLPTRSRWSWLRLALPALALPSLIALLVLREFPLTDESQVQFTENAVLSIYVEADRAAFDDNFSGEEIEDWIL